MYEGFTCSTDETTEPAEGELEEVAADAAASSSARNLAPEIQAIGM